MLGARHRRSRVRVWGVGALVIASIALAACGGTEFPRSAVQRVRSPGAIGPFVFDPSNPTKPDTHWHAALGVYDCDHWMGDSTGRGIWNWPAATLQGSPARAAEPSLYAGLHSHDDGVIHMEPLVSAEAGRNATVGLYFDYGGWKLSQTGFSFLGTTVKNGDKCGTATGTLQWELGKWDGTSGKQKYKPMTGNPASYKLYQGDIVVIAFLPPGKAISSIGDPPSVSHLANALGVENVAPGQSVPTTPTTLPTVSVPATTAPKGGTVTTVSPTTVTPTSETPTTKKP